MRAYRKAFEQASQDHPDDVIARYDQIYALTGSADWQWQCIIEQARQGLPCNFDRRKTDMVLDVLLRLGIMPLLKEEYERRRGNPVHEEEFRAWWFRALCAYPDPPRY